MCHVKSVAKNLFLGLQSSIGLGNYLKCFEGGLFEREVKFAQSVSSGTLKKDTAKKLRIFLNLICAKLARDQSCVRVKRSRDVVKVHLDLDLPALQAADHPLVSTHRSFDFHNVFA